MVSCFKIGWVAGRLGSWGAGERGRENQRRINGRRLSYGRVWQDARGEGKVMSEAGMQIISSPLRVREQVGQASSTRVVVVISRK